MLTIIALQTIFADYLSKGWYLQIAHIYTIDISTLHPLKSPVSSPALALQLANTPAQKLHMCDLSGINEYVHLAVQGRQ